MILRQHYAGNCGECHPPQQTGSPLGVGPDLIHSYGPGTQHRWWRQCWGSTKLPSFFSVLPCPGDNPSLSPTCFQSLF